MGIDYALVPFNEVGLEIAENVPRHYEAVPHFGRPNPDWEHYFNSYVVTARDSGKLIGYSAFFVNTNVNHKHIVEAENAGIFVDPAYRGRVSVELIKKSDQFLKDNGVHVINYAVHDERIGRLLARQGYKPMQIVWSK